MDSVPVGGGGNGFLTLQFNIAFYEFMNSVIKKVGKLIGEELIERS